MPFADLAHIRLHYWFTGPLIEQAPAFTAALLAHCTA